MSINVDLIAHRLCVLVCMLSLTACGGGGGSSDGDSDNRGTGNGVLTVQIPVKAIANGVQLDCDAALTGLGTAGTDARLLDARFYLHDVALVAADGSQDLITLDANEWQAHNLVLIDFQNRADNCGGEPKPTHALISGTVPDTGKTYVGLKFVMGVPEALNHQNQTAATAPLNIPSLFWSWQSGYKFLRLDVAPVGGIIRPGNAGFSATTWNIHLGSTDCSGDPQAGAVVSCSRLNRANVVLTPYALGQTLVFDYAALVAATNLGIDMAGPAGCMSGLSDPECQALFERLGIDFSSGLAKDGQAVFRIE